MRIVRLVAVMAALALSTAVASAQATTGTAAANNTVVVNATTGFGTGSGSGSGSGTDGSGGTSSTQRVIYSGHEYSTPSVQGSYFAGANPCLIGVGASGAGGPVGLSFTFGRNDEGCNRRSDAAAWHALGHDDVAMARMCQDEDNEKAFQALGYTCPQNRSKVATVVPPPVVNQPVGYQVPLIDPVSPVMPPPVRMPPVGSLAPAQKIAKVRPEWCWNASAAELKVHASACSVS